MNEGIKPLDRFKQFQQAFTPAESSTNLFQLYLDAAQPYNDDEFRAFLKKNKHLLTYLGTGKKSKGETYDLYGVSAVQKGVEQVAFTEYGVCVVVDSPNGENGSKKSVQVANILYAQERGFCKEGHLLSLISPEELMNGLLRAEEDFVSRVESELGMQ